MIPAAFPTNTPIILSDSDFVVLDWKKLFEDRVFDMANLTRWRAFKICKNDLDGIIQLFYKDSTVSEGPWLGLNGNSQGEGKNTFFENYFYLLFRYSIGLELSNQRRTTRVYSSS